MPTCRAGRIPVYVIRGFGWWQDLSPKLPSDSDRVVHRFAFLANIVSLRLDLILALRRPCQLNSLCPARQVDVHNQVVARNGRKAPRGRCLRILRSSLCRVGLLIPRRYTAAPLSLCDFTLSRLGFFTLFVLALLPVEVAASLRNCMPRKDAVEALPQVHHALVPMRFA